MSHKIAETLRAARAKIEKPENWTTHKMARDVSGALVEPDSPAAVCWCALGALSAVGNDSQYSSERALRDVMGVYVGDFNDTHTHAEVLAAFDAAIAAAEAAP